jgi:hypothetical protein
MSRSTNEGRGDSGIRGTLGPPTAKAPIIASLIRVPCHLRRVVRYAVQHPSVGRGPEGREEQSTRVRRGRRRARRRGEGSRHLSPPPPTPSSSPQPLRWAGGGGGGGGPPGQFGHGSPTRRSAPLVPYYLHGFPSYFSGATAGSSRRSPRAGAGPIGPLRSGILRPRPLRVEVPWRSPSFVPPAVVAARESEIHRACAAPGGSRAPNCWSRYSGCSSRRRVVGRARRRVRGCRRRQ